MKEDRSPEVQAFFDSVKHQLLDVLPNSLSGYLILVLVLGIWLKTNSLEFLGSVAETGIYIFVVGSCYYLGNAVRFLVNDLLSRFTHEKREDDPA